MTPYQFTPQAIDDLFEIWSYVAQDDLEAANRVEEAVYFACDQIAERPQIGHVRSDLTPLPLRFWPALPYRSYLIVYDPKTKPLRIVRILHGARDIPAALR